MSEIEKMYRRCKIKKRQTCRSSDTCYNGSLNACEGCNSYQYPPFTAEKQLKILCFIVNKKHSVTFHDQVFEGDKLTLEKIQENLAWAINRIRQDLTEQEQEQIRSILE